MMRPRNFKNLFCLFLLFFFLTLDAQVKNTNYQIGITTGTFTPEISSKKELEIVNADTFGNTYYKILQFYSIPTETIRKQWEKQGLKLMDYLPGNAYFAAIDASYDLKQIASSIRSVINVDNRFKLEESVFSKGIPTHAIKEGSAELIISYYQGIDGKDISLKLKEIGIKVISLNESVNQINISIKPNRLNELVALPFVQFINAVTTEPVLEGEDYRNTTARSNYLNTGYNGLNYNGSGVTLAVGEGGTLIDEVDAKGRIVLEENSGEPTHHKTIVFRSMAGAGNWDASNRNQAWGANIVSTGSNENYGSLFNSHQVLYTNHSFGWSVSGGYNSRARNHDLLLANYPQHLVLYSAGNSGTSTGYAPYNINSWANITGPSKMNKNMVTVGSLLVNDAKSTGSSNGPMYDGRIAPQIVVEGSEGTSLAAPKATGIFGMLAQVYKDQHSAAVPASSLLRAIVFNTADDIENQGPDFKTGFGRINARRAYDAMTNNQYLSSSISNQQTNQHVIVIPPNTTQVKAMIVWPDVAAAINANPAIVNDLNIVLKDPNNNSYNPWVLDASLPSSDGKLNAVAVRGVDHINTMEQVTVDNPASGNWTLEVSGFNVPSGPQSYFIAYEFLKNEVKLMYPLQGDRMNSKEQYQLKWDSAGNAETFTLEYQLDNGAWVTIATGYDASSRNYTWTAPLVSGVHTIKFRIKKGNLISESGTNYIGQLVENLKITKGCNDVVTLKWSPLNDVTSYKIYRLGAKYMEEVTSNITFNGSSAVLTGQSTTAKEYYTVSPLTGTLEGQKSLTITKEIGDFNCVGINWTGNVSTDWFDAGNWDLGSVPTENNSVGIPSSPPNQPLIANAGAVCLNITIDTGASLSMDNNSAFTLSVGGDWINNGQFNSGIGIVDFVNNNFYQEISGNSKTNFYILKLTKGSVDKVLETTSLIELKAASNPLNITSGTFKLSSASTIKPFTSAAGANLSGLKGLWNNGGIINYDNINWFLNAGLLRISAGIINMGTNANANITYLNNGRLIIENGTLNMTGRFLPNSSTSSGIYSQSGGTLNLKAQGSAAFDLNANTSFTMSGGLITIAKRSSHSNYDMKISSNTRSVSGGTVQIGDDTTPVNQIIRISSLAPIYNLVVNTNNNPTAQIVDDNFTVNNVYINGGSLNANGFNMNVGGNWTNNANFIAGGGAVTFDGVSAQNLAGNATSIFNNLILKNNNGINLSGTVNATINGELTLASGVITTGNNTLIIGANGSVSRTSGHIFGKLQKTIPVGSNVKANFEIGDAVITNYAPVNLTFNSVVTSGSLTANTVDADHPSISNSNLNTGKSVNRYWTLNNLGIVFTNYDATFSFLSSDLDPSTNWNNLICGKFNAPVWSYPTIGNKTASSLQIVNANSFSDFQLSENSGFLNTDNLNKENRDVTIYPNPVLDKLYLSTSKTIEKIEIYSISGGLVKTFDKPQKSIDVKELLEGVYLLKIYIGNSKEILIKKVIKQ